MMIKKGPIVFLLSVYLFILPFNIQNVSDAESYLFPQSTATENFIEMIINLWYFKFMDHLMMK